MVPFSAGDLNAGLLAPISSMRSCPDIEAVFKDEFTNKCICEQKFETASSVETKTILPLIENALRKLVPENATNICQPFTLTTGKRSLQKTKTESHPENGMTKDTLDLTKYHGLLEVENYVFKDSKVLFSFVAEFSKNKNMFELKWFDRNDIFSRFKDCASKVPWVDIRICICA